MASKVFHHLLNVGVADDDKLHRVDLERMRLATADQTNLLCDVVGKGFVRPGLEFLHQNHGTNGKKARLITFDAGADARYVLEFTDQVMRVVDHQQQALIERPTVTSTVPSGDFSASTGWTLASTSGQTSTISGGKLNLTARARGAEAKATASFTINQNLEHGLRIVVDRGPVTFRLGSTSGGQELIRETTLRTGEHSLAFTPNGAGTAYIEFSSKATSLKIVDSCTVEAAGPISLPTVWPEAALRKIRYDQSQDVMYLACRGYQQQRIERRGDGASAGRSWSVVDYTADDGPFLVGRTASVKLTPSVLEGNGTLTSDKPFFRSAHVGALFYLGHKGQRVDTYLAGSEQFTPPIEITGVNETSYNDRDFTYTISGTWSGTLRVQRSFDSELTGYQQFRREQASSTIDITANATFIDDDNEDNAIGWYRVGFEAGGYTSGEARVVMQYAGGVGYGICRVVGYTSATQVDIEVLRPFSGDYATDDWREGAWSDNMGWPYAVRFTEGRLIWVGADKVWGSVSDAFESFDETYEGEAAPLLRSIAIGGRNDGVWAINLSTLMVGTNQRVVTVRANSLEDILTPTNLKIVPVAKVGSYAEADPIEAAENRALFVQEAGRTIFELSYDATTGAFVATPFSKLTTKLFENGITGFAISTIPDQRIWVTVDDANAVCIVYEPGQKVTAFIPIATADGDIIESICSVGAAEQERVYMSVLRTIDGVEHRYTELLALDRESAPATITKCMDSFVSGTGAHSATIDGLDHLEGRTVVAWVDGAPVASTFTVDGGEITLPAAPTEGWCVGLRYEWNYESARLEYGAPNSHPILDVKVVEGLSVLFADYVRSGIRFGTINADGQSSTMDGLPSRIRGAIAANVVAGKAKDESPYPIPGGASLDQRVRITGASPYPASILGIVMGVG